VGWIRSEDEKKFIQFQLVIRFRRQNEVAEMGWVEGAAEDADAHGA
jgi:hypothetical protein